MKNLALSRLPVKPTDFFVKLAEECETYSVDKFDVYNDYDQSPETSSLRAFEVDVAVYVGKESGLFLPSGVMAQMMILASCKEISGSNNFMCHWSSHLLLWEHDSFKQLLAMKALVVPPSNPDGAVQEPVTYSSFLRTFNEVSDGGVAVVIIECPHREIGGKITSYEDLKQISEFCRAKKIHLHMDGARLWEATAAYQIDCSVTELCTLFDTVYVSFYKGLGAVTGAMLLGSTSYIQDHARIWLRRFGGNLFSHLPYYLSCWSSFRQNKDAFVARKEKFVEIVNHLTVELLSQKINNCSFADGHVDKLIYFDPPLPTVSLTHVYVRGDPATVMLANNNAAQKSGIICFTRMKPGRYGAKDYSVTEINLVSYSFFLLILCSLFFLFGLFQGPGNMTYSKEEWLLGYRTLLEEISLLLNR
jgi:prepilin-type processing-associated H-X9-DG protein